MQAQMAAQREAAPVYWYEAPALATGFWVLSKRADCRFVGSNPELFCNKYGFAVGDANEPTETVLNQLPEWAREELAKPDVTPAQRRGLIARGKLSLGDPALENMIFLDPPRHGQVRRIFMGALKPSLVRRLKPRMAEIADEFLDEMVKPGDEVDFVRTIGRVPAAVMTEMVGVPPSEGERRNRRRPDQRRRAVRARRRARAPFDRLRVRDALPQCRRDDTGAPVAPGDGARPASRPAQAPARPAGAPPERDRGDAALLPDQLDRVPDGHAAGRGRRADDRQGRLRGDGVRRREP